MNCKQVHEQFLDLVSASAGSPALDEHLRACGDCATKLAELRRTMSLLDEWQAPQPSAYFDTRLRTRLREEAQSPRTWTEWMHDAFSPFTTLGRKVALVSCMALLMAVGASLFQGAGVKPGPGTGPDVVVTKGTAVADLQALDKDKDLYADFDLLDDVAVNP